MRPATHRFGTAAPLAEPPRGAGRPSSVLSVGLRRAVSVSLLAASLVTLSAACGRQHPAAGASPSHRADGGVPSSPAGTPYRQARVDDRLVFFTSATGAVRQVRAMLRGPDELSAFARLFRGQAPEIMAKAENTDFTRTTLVGWSTTTGCAKWPSASLHRTDDTLSLVAGPHPKAPPECFAPFHVISVFEVPKERLPERPRFAD